MNQEQRNDYLAERWTGPGWNKIILDCDREMSAVDPEYTILQIKEKFGGLRYYVSTSSEELWDIESKYEALSFTICELCGSEKDVTTGPMGESRFWSITACGACRAKGETNE